MGNQSWPKLIIRSFRSKTQDSFRQGTLLVQLMMSCCLFTKSFSIYQMIPLAETNNQRQWPQLKIVMLSMYEDGQFVTQAFAAGAAGYVLKKSLEDELFTALEQVMAGGRFVSEEVKVSAETNTSLTSREAELLQLIAEGHNTTEIAALMGISPHTASRHRVNLMQKLDAHTQAGLVRTAIELGLIIVKQPPF